MAASGVFQLLINEGIEDKFLTATELIRANIRRILCQNGAVVNESGPINLQNIDVNKLPTLTDIHKTHILFCDYSYRPFVAIGTQYNKKSCTADFGKRVTIGLDKFGQFISDMVLHVRLSKFRAKDSRDRVSYTAFPGHKLLKKVKFQVNQVDIDEYDTEDYNNYYQYQLGAEDRVGWDRCVGQEVPFACKLVADPLFDMHQEERRFFNGAQTPKHEQDALDLWIPLLFWFRDYKQALPAYMINWGLTEVQVEFAALKEMIVFADYGGGGAYYDPKIEVCELYTNNIFINDDVFYLFSRHISVLLFRRHRALNDILIYKDASIKLDNYLKGPIEQLHVAFRPKSNSNLYQHWYKNSRLIPRHYRLPVLAKDPTVMVTGTVLSATRATYFNDSIVSGATVALQGAGLSSTDDYYLNYELVLISGMTYDPDNVLNNRYTVVKYDAATQTVTIRGEWFRLQPQPGDSFELFTQVLSSQIATFYEEYPSINTLELVAYGNPLVDSTQEARFNYYSPIQSKSINAPIDRGSYMFNFALNPYHLQPSGHMNLSSSKETYLRYTSNWISSANRVELIVRATAINFLHIDRAAGTVNIVYP